MSYIRKITGGIEYEYGGIILNNANELTFPVSINGETKYLYPYVRYGAFQYLQDVGVITSPNFEDMYLNDQEHLLRIQFNPKVSSFKTIIEEQKIHTIGNQYPFFFRNGNIKYREMSISGLISYLSDPLKLLDQNNTLTNRIYYPDEPLDVLSPAVKGQVLGDYIDDFYFEQQYKLAAEEWLNNGQPKYFKTPGEGNYWVRLMNVSLSPMEQLGRRLHTFSATAYEVAPPSWYIEAISAAAMTLENNEQQAIEEVSENV